MNLKIEKPEGVKVGTIRVNGLLCEVFKIEDYWHDKNILKERNNWWINYTSDRFSQGGEKLWKPSLIPFGTNHKINNFEFHITESFIINGDVSNYVNVSVSLDNLLAFEKRYDSITLASSDLPRLRKELEECPFNFENPEEDFNREISWNELPVRIGRKISVAISDIVILPNFTKELNKEEWTAKYDKMVHLKGSEFEFSNEKVFYDSSELDFYKEINVMIDKNINWGVECLEKY